MCTLTIPHTVVQLYEVNNHQKYICSAVATIVSQVLFNQEPNALWNAQVEVSFTMLDTAFQLYEVNVPHR